MPTLAFKAATCFAFLLCMVCFGRLHFYRDPGSVFFDKERAYETHYSAHRRVEAQQVIDSYTNDKNTFPSNRSGTNKSFCVALSSVKRQTQYLQVTRCRPQCTRGRELTALAKYRQRSELFCMDSRHRNELISIFLSSSPKPTRHATRAGTKNGFAEQPTMFIPTR